MPQSSLSPTPEFVTNQALSIISFQLSLLEQIPDAEGNVLFGFSLESAKQKVELCLATISEMNFIAPQFAEFAEDAKEYEAKISNQKAMITQLIERCNHLEQEKEAMRQSNFLNVDEAKKWMEEKVFTLLKGSQ